MLDIKDPNQFVSAFMEGLSYKHLNVIIPVITNVLTSEDIRVVVEQWLNQEEHLKQLAFIENLLHPETWKEDGFMQLMQHFKGGQHITVEEWQAETQGQGILVANNQFFALIPVTILIGTSINTEVLDYLQGEMDKLMDAYKQEYEMCSQYPDFSNQSPIIQFICIQSWASIEWWVKMFYDYTSFVNRRANHFNTAIGLMSKYLRANPKRIK